MMAGPDVVRDSSLGLSLKGFTLSMVLVCHGPNVACPKQARCPESCCDELVSPSCNDGWSSRRSGLFTAFVFERVHLVDVMLLRLIGLCRGFFSKFGICN